MVILAFDSTSRVATVAVADGARVLSSFSADSGLTQSELLLPMAREALTAAHLGFDDVDLYAVTVGPGSFTGVRIGAAVVKGLAFSRDVPCAPVSTLEALAENLVPLDGLFCPVMDARRGTVYSALFRAENGAPLRLSDDRLLPLADLIAELKQAYPGTPVRFVGDAAGTAEDAARAAGLSVAPVPASLVLQNAGSVARCGARLAAASKAVSPAALAPVYLRATQAERDRLEKEKSNQ